jgi:C1A family cysteine protease
MKTRFLLLNLMFLIFLNLANASQSRQVYKEVVLGEIQATFIKDYKVDKEFFEPVRNVPAPKKDISKDNNTIVLRPTPEPTIEPTPAKNIVVRPKKKKRKKKRGLLDFDEEDNLDDGRLGKKTSKNRNKRGLIEDDDFKAIPFEFKKNKATGIIGPKKNIQLKRNDWASKKLRERNNWQNKSLKSADSWYAEKMKILSDWNKALKIYKKNLPTYKKNLVNFESFGSSNISQKNQSLKVRAIGTDFLTIPKAFFSNVNDQGRRPTCAAFAATRAIEIALAQSGIEEKLSEQFFYYASKPQCQSSPCSKKGSWPLRAFNKSKNSSNPDIPLASACPYKKQSKSGNETQVPLRDTCFQGRHKLTKFTKAQSLQSIINQLNRGAAVVSAFKLSPNFYTNKGVVLYKDSLKSGSMNSHAAGHAVLLIGYMKIPGSLNEGQICFITANSWGTGWGKGGHACLSEKWVNKYRFSIPFLAVNSVR